MISARIDARGGLFNESPSRPTCALRHTSLLCAKLECSFPVQLMMRAPFFKSVSTVAFNSEVSPLLLIAITTSPVSTCPLDPCTASVPCNSYDGVPVEDNRLAI